MFGSLQLGYLLLSVADPEPLDQILHDVVGLLSFRLEDGAIAYRMDNWDRRVIVVPGEGDRYTVGLVAADPAEYRVFRDRLEQTSVIVSEGSAKECAIRAVREFVAFRDPAGNELELATGPTRARGMSFVSPLVPGGFLTGNQGLGHVVLIVDNRDASVEFYVRVLGFGLSDTSEHRQGDTLSEATFLHCNRRHHTIALVQKVPSLAETPVLGHVMVQMNRLDGVGMAYDRALAEGIPIFRGIGRHPNDQMFSFYVRTGAGFDVEVGADAVEIDGQWEVSHYQEISMWGHQPGPRI
jgi:biphenyl-2,3-diol 1,2-dioxygenase